MTRSPRRVLCGILIAGGAVAGTAMAADPGTGTVSKSSPNVTWKGEVTASWTPSRLVIAENAAGQDGATPCSAPTCDEFVLTVADSDNLSIGADGPGEASDPDQVIIRIEKPDGSYLTTVGDASAGKPLTVKFKNAATGQYTVDYWNYYIDGTTPYSGFAALGSSTPAPAPTPTPTPTPSGGSGGPQPGSPGSNPGSSGSAQNIDISVKAGKASARKLKRKRKLAVKVTVSRSVKSVSAFLRKGKKTVAKGKRGATTGTAKLKVKFSKKAARKLRKGTYALTVVADDGAGTTASKTIKVKVKK